MRGIDSSDRIVRTVTPIKWAIPQRFFFDEEKEQDPALKNSHIERNIRGEMPCNQAWLSLALLFHEPNTLCVCRREKQARCWMTNTRDSIKWARRSLPLGRSQEPYFSRRQQIRGWKQEEEEGALILMGISWTLIGFTTRRPVSISRDWKEDSAFVNGRKGKNRARPNRGEKPLNGRRSNIGQYSFFFPGRDWVLRSLFKDIFRKCLLRERKKKYFTVGDRQGQIGYILSFEFV